MQEKVLIVDDEQHIIDGYQRGLRKRYQLETALDGQRALELTTEKGPFAVVVSDMKMPGMDGAELLSKMQVVAPDTVRVMLTGNADQQTAAEAVNKGGIFHFLNKPCSSDDMAKVLDGAISKYRETMKQHSILEKKTAEVIELNEKIADHTKHDLLTGLDNRHTFNHRVESLLQHSNDNSEHALCFIDLDQFHLINDRFGMVAGDEVLKEVAQVISYISQDNDLTVHLHSDEFAIFLSNRSLKEARTVAAEILEILQEISFQWEGHSIDIQACIGLITVDTKDTDVDALLSRGQTACFVAKETGKNRLHVGRPGDTEHTNRINQAQWVTRIRKALDEDRFQLNFQTITPLNDKQEGLHYEILVRMIDDDGKMISPGLFLPAAEQYYLSCELDCWVISHTVDWLKQHPQHLEKLSLCSINLSGHSLGNTDVLDFINKTFADGAVPADKICWEVTETAAIARINDAIHFIDHLRLMGFHFALDDFGSGLSSFAYLKNLPVDYLKIDGMFVKHMDIDSVDHAMVKSITEIGQLIGKKVIAEFVENEAILKLLREMKVDYAQGYLIDKPRPLSEITDFK